MKRKRSQAGVRRPERLVKDQPPSVGDQSRTTSELEEDQSPEVLDGNPDSPSFPLRKLPRELRDRVYDFHLQEVCKESRLRNWTYFWGEHPDRREPEAPEAPDRLGFFYEPIFIHRMVQDSLWLTKPTHQAREHPIPPLTLVDGSAVAEEAWQYYANRLIVHTDALNRFQAWCEETLEPGKFLRLRKLYVVTSAEYRHDTGFKAPYVVDEQYPAFLIEIDEVRQEIIMSCRFALKDFALPILRANLHTLMSERLKTKTQLDGRDIIEAMFALHNHATSGQSRQSLVIGPLSKGNVRWMFFVDDEALQKVEQFGKTDRERLEEAVERTRRFNHVVYRGRVG